MQAMGNYGARKNIILGLAQRKTNIIDLLQNKMSKYKINNGLFSPRSP
jgi:hypothetical protein